MISKAITRHQPRLVPRDFTATASLSRHKTMPKYSSMLKSVNALVNGPFPNYLPVRQKYVTIMLSSTLGSMNDRISQVPPAPYLESVETLSNNGDSEINYVSESYSRQAAENTNRFTSESSSTYRAENRNSSLLKVGRYIAATLNLSSWKIWPKTEFEKDEENVQKQIFNERQERAEKIYKELKKLGQFKNTVAEPPAWHDENTILIHTPLSDKSESSIACYKRPTELLRPGKIRNQISLRSLRTRENEKQNQNFVDSPIERPYLRTINQSKSSTTLTDSPHYHSLSPKKSFCHIKSTSLSTIGKAFASSSVTNLPVSSNQYTSNCPSRKELNRQQILVKRVSNLETKLEIARRQLAEAQGLACNSYVQNYAPNSTWTQGKSDPTSLCAFEILPNQVNFKGNEEKSPSERIDGGRIASCDNPKFNANHINVSQSHFSDSEDEQAPADTDFLSKFTSKRKNQENNRSCKKRTALSPMNPKSTEPTLKIKHDRMLSKNYVSMEHIGEKHRSNVSATRNFSLPPDKSILREKNRDSLDSQSMLQETNSNLISHNNSPNSGTSGAKESLNTSAHPTIGYEPRHTSPLRDLDSSSSLDDEDRSLFSHPSCVGKNSPQLSTSSDDPEHEFEERTIGRLTTAPPLPIASKSHVLKTWDLIQDSASQSKERSPGKVNSIVEQLEQPHVTNLKLVATKPTSFPVAQQPKDPSQENSFRWPDYIF
ncbi:hypothetical protein BGHDH14_bgh03056 [Blumeria hordei DH14]|uniref:Uncharacterized protein n=1 Tax=Blumeria graminis f. sp. hordei (strain DH14) TaxID=546991 RepID=N1JEA3_BLUG1|nr:hypothetical protein BGHDH14_bgh03056 [Blumeria hordei DH14]